MPKVKITERDAYGATLTIETERGDYGARIESESVTTASGEVTHAYLQHVGRDGQQGRFRAELSDLTDKANEPIPETNKLFDPFNSRPTAQQRRRMNAQ